MFYSYITSIAILSFALYGVWHLLQDIWEMCITPRLAEQPIISLLLIVKNSEQFIEGMIRYLLSVTADHSTRIDIVVVDYDSDDITPLILERLVDEEPNFKVVHLPEGVRPTAEGLCYCQGEVVYIFDMVSRLQPETFMASLPLILRNI